MKEIGNKVKTQVCWNNQGRTNHCQHWGCDRWENRRGKQDVDVKLVEKGCWNIRKNLQNQESVNRYQLAGFTALSWFYGRSPQCFLRPMMGVSIQPWWRLLPVDSHHFKGSSEQGGAGLSQQLGRELGIPWAGHAHSLQEAAVSGVSILQGKQCHASTKMTTLS